MVGKDRALSVCEAAISACGADEAEAVLMLETDSLTRFANSEIHQNTAVDDATLFVRAVSGTRAGWASTNQITHDAAQAAALRAVQMARVQPETPDASGLADPAEYEEAEGYDERTSAFTPADRAQAVSRIVRQADVHGLNASGSLRTRVTEVAVANSRGVRAWTRGTDASLITVVMTGFESDAGSGYAEAASRRVGDLDFEALGATAVRKCLAARHPGDVEPGEYVVVMEPSAVATTLQMLAYMGMNGISFIEGRSYASGRLGTKVTSGMVTIVDDWRDPDTSPLPFDFEGVPRQRVTLIEQGMASGMIYDRSAAARANTRSTGHAVPGGGMPGGYPLHLVMDGGDSSIEEMVAGTERGIYITRFNYANPVHPVKTIFTGMTKDGTFMIEDGRIGRPLRNLRFTDSILDGLFAGVADVSRATRLLPTGNGTSIYRAPAIRARLKITGSTV
ncbi:MAG: TldD/PmbA family protein [Firmicutes bacterium]|jgi:PmbA protein|nr:TldD/PmbA family protein [Bacillota bacterium]